MDDGRIVSGAAVLFAGGVSRPRGWIDTSKAAFTLHRIDQHDRPTLRVNLRRAQVILFFRKLPRRDCRGSLWWRAALGSQIDRTRARGAFDPAAAIRQTLRQAWQE